MAKLAFANDIKVNTISSDIYFRNRENGPVFDLGTTMNKMLHVGYSLKEVIDSVTVNAAHALQLNMLGSLEVGKLADFTVFKMVQAKQVLIDSLKQEVYTQQYLQPTFTIVKNKLYKLKEES